MSRPTARIALVLAALVALDLAAFWQLPTHRFSGLDVAVYVHENLMVREGFSAEGVAWAFDPRHAYAANWHPLTWLSHMLDCQLFGTRSPVGPLAVNLLLHTLNTCLLFVALWRLTDRGDNKSDGVNLWASAMVAALFGIHPLHVESVACLATRKDVLSGLFFMLTLWAYAGYSRRPTWQRMALVSLCLTLGLMAKPTLVTLPFVLLLLDVWPLARAAFDWGSQTKAGAKVQTKAPTHRSWRPLVVEKLPLFGLIVASSAITYVVQKAGGAVNPISLSQRLAGGVWAYGIYLWKTIWPAGLSFFYPRNASDDATFRMQLAASALVLVCVTALAIHQRRRRPYLLVGWLWYLGTLVPMSGIGVQVGEQSMADRYTYLPLIGIFIMLVWGAIDVARAVAGSAAAKRVLGAAAAITLAALVVLTSRQVATWQDNETLFRHGTLVTRDNAFAHTSLGMALRADHKLEEALAECRASTAIDPDDWTGRTNLALVLMDLNRLSEALPEAQAATRLMPGVALPHLALGSILARSGDAKAAIGEYQAALALDATRTSTHILYGQSLSSMGRYAEAVQQFDQALQLDPADSTALVGRIEALAQSGRGEEALKQARAALATAPDSPRLVAAVGTALLALGKPQEAVAHFQNTLKSHPQMAGAHFGLASSLAAADDRTAAAAAFAEAIRLNSENAPYRLAAIDNLLALKDLSAAATAAEQLLKLAPQDPQALRLRAEILHRQGQAPAAIQAYRALLKRSPQEIGAVNNLAWLLATSGSGTADAQEAISLAEKVCQATEFKRPEPLDTLAIAYASAGRFADAVRVAEQGIQLAKQQDNKALVETLSQRLATYRAGKMPEIQE